MRSNLPDAEQFQDWVSAVFGQLAGAYYGIGGISEACKDKIVRHDLIEELAGMLIPALA
jgi:ADP-ribosylglycohydrolase